MNTKVPTINWRTGGAVSKGWAYENNAIRLKKELRGFRHVFDETYQTDIAVYFDVLVHKRTGHIGKRNILRLGGPRPMQRLYGSDKNKRLKEIAKFDAVIALSPQLYQIAKEANKNTFLVPNGLDLKKWNVHDRTENHKFVVGFAGSIVNKTERETKGFDYVDQACKQLGFELISFLKSKKQIPHDRMQEEFYRRIDCLLHPVKAGKEGSSNVIMEALATGVPVVTTRDAGYHGDFLVHGKNVMFCERDLNHITEILQTLQKDTELRARLAREGRKFCEQHHNIKTIAKTYREIISN